MPPPDAWDDDWEAAADTAPSETPKKPSSKITKARRRAAQAEFNRQLWEEADGPREPNYFLETRDVVPKADFKPPPTLLTRKGPGQLNGNGSSSDEDEDGNKKKKKQLTIEEQRALVARERGEKQRKYEERRMELFGSTATSTLPPKPGSGRSSPGAGLETPPGSRSGTPNRSRGGRGGGGGEAAAAGARKMDSFSRPPSSTSSLSLKPSSIAPSVVKKELYDPNYTSTKPDSSFTRTESRENVVEPIRSPRGPDGSGRGGIGFVTRGGKAHVSMARTSI